MAFILTKKRIVEWPVTIEVPVDGGSTIEQHCSATFEIINQDEYNQLSNDDMAFLDRVVVAFGTDIQNDDGTPLKCTKENKKALFGSGGFVRIAFINAYHSASTGIGAKNSKGPLSTSRAVRKTRKRK